MKRTDPKLKAAVVWGALFVGALFWVTVAMLVVELWSLIAGAF